MKNIGFTPDNIDSVLEIVVAILNMGNIVFETVNKPGTGDVGGITASTKSYLENAAKHLRLTPAQLEGALTTKVSIIGKDVITTNLPEEQCVNARDGLAKTIYAKLFNWLVKRVNQSISKKMGAGQAKD